MVWRSRERRVGHPFGRDALGVAVRGLAAAGLVMVTLGGCSTPDDRGPLVVPRDPGGTCMPAALYSATAMGTTVLNDSDSELRITRVDMVGAHGLRMESNSLMPSPTQFLLADAFPPTDQFPTEWPLAQSIADAPLAPNEQHVSLVTELHLEQGAESGALERLDIYYTDESGREYVERTDHSLEIREGSCE